jgi:hypothetical protein
MMPLNDAHSELEEIVAMKRRALNYVLQQPYRFGIRACMLMSCYDILA